MLTAKQVLRMIPISRTTLFRWERDGSFPKGHTPKGHAPTQNRKLWFKDEVTAWQRALYSDPKA